MSNYILSIVAGNGTQGTPVAGQATSSPLNFPLDVYLDSLGNLYIGDYGNNLVEKVTPDGTLSIVAGNGTQGAPTPGPATDSALNGPYGVFVDFDGNLYISDFNNNVIEKVTPGGTLSIVAGNGTQGAPTPGPATESSLYQPSGIFVDSQGNLYIADTSNSVIEKVTPDGVLSIVAGIVGTEGAPTPGPATESSLLYPQGICFDSQGNFYIADAGNLVIEKVTPEGILSVIAGIVGSFGTPTPGPATQSSLSYMGPGCIDIQGNYYVGDAYNYVIEKLTPSYPCFLETSQILTDKGYQPIKDLRKGDLVKTLNHGFQPIVMIGKRDIVHPACEERIKDQLYQCSSNQFDEVFDDLVITGCHSILIDGFISEEQRQKTIEVNGDTYVTDGKYRLPACADLRTSVYPVPGTYTIYHMALENDNYYFNYGIYANGLLVETCSQRYLKEFSGMVLL